MGDAQDIVIGGFETVNLVTTNTGATEEQNIGAITMTADTGGTTTLNISGTNAIDAAVITADVLNVSGLTAQAAGTTTFEQTAALVATAAGTATITGSAGDDILVGVLMILPISMVVLVMTISQVVLMQRQSVVVTVTTLSLAEAVPT